MSSPRRVVISGIGPLTAAGIGVAGLRSGLHSGQSPIHTVTRFDSAPFRSTMAAEILDFDGVAFLGQKVARRTDRFVQYALVSSLLALHDAGLGDGVGSATHRHPESGARGPEVDLDPDRTAIMMGSAMGGIAQAEVQLRTFIERGSRALDPRLATTTFAGAASCQIAIHLGVRGPNSTNAMSCAAGTMAIGEGARLVRQGIVDVALVGGADAPLAPVCYGAFAALRAMSKRNGCPAEACRPFDRERDGFVMGEGACMLVLEDSERARSRGARVYAEVGGYGTNNDAYHMAAPHADGSVAAEAISTALSSAGASASVVDHVNAHASSTLLNDRAESTAIRRALGPWADQVSVSGTKPFHGHALGASGAIEAAITALSIHDAWAPPTLNLADPGEGCDLDYVTDAGRDGAIDVALTNSFGFGGINAVLLLTAPGWSTTT